MFQLCRFDEVVGPASVIAVGIAATEIESACNLLGLRDAQEVAFQVRSMSIAAVTWINDRRAR